jgi:two-component system sensor histidine kinase RegB
MFLSTESFVPARLTPLSFSKLLLTEHEPQIALAALTRLRWLAVIGQLAATFVAVYLLKLDLPLLPIGVVILFTALSNAIAVWGIRTRKPSVRLVELLILLDVGALTALLYYTGGPANPFSILYLVHVAMAVVVLGFAWTWLVVGVAALCYGALFAWHVPLTGPAMPPWIVGVGNWISLVLVAVLIATFIGRVERSLRHREHELTDARERAARNEQLAALTTLAAGAAHELNTPLGTIAVVAKELEGADESIREDAQLIRHEVDRCREIITRLRFDVGEELSHRKSVDVSSMVHHLRQDLRPHEAARLRVQTGADVDRVMAPARALEQALLVLLRNAFDASPADAPVTLSIHKHDGGTQFLVEDHGTGMSDELLKHAGQPFFTTKEPGKGMGLGLFLVRLVAEQSGADFSIDSKPGVGTRCVLELPDVKANNGKQATGRS